MHKADFGIRLKDLYLPCQILWKHQVVLMEETNVFSLGQFETAIPVAGNAQLSIVPMNRDAWIMKRTSNI